MIPEWLPNAVFYQIYPQSYQDTNGDGIGDFQGITERLDYIRSLGVTALWLNPCFDSTFNDAGYDVTNFYAVAPRYGTENELKTLFQEAHARNMHVILDLVAGHTSIAHPWFQAEAANPTNPESNRYIWKNRAFDTTRGPSKSDFVANFFWHQPALNYGYADPKLPWQDLVDAPGPQKNRRELRAIMSYWFDCGCDGFRVDMAGSLVKNDSHARETIKLWQSMRHWLDEKYPGRALVAEWSDPALSIPAGFHLDFLMHFNAPGYPSLFFNGKGTLPAKEGPCYFDAAAQGQLTLFKEEYTRQRAATQGKGYISLPTANHDFQRPRCGSRGWEGLRPAWVFLMTQGGIPAIYYGDEIGMRFVQDTPAKEGSTLEGIEAPNAGAPDGERAGTRTPMQWDDTANAGFSTANPEQLYLPLDPDPDRPSVAAQDGDPDSLLNFVRRLLDIRRRHPALGANGEFTILNPNDHPYPLLYTRSLNGSTYLVGVNPAREKRALRLPMTTTEPETILNRGCSLTCGSQELQAAIEPFGYGIFKLRP